ncbi:MAG: PTS sugar transporter subunit IIA [Nitrospinae bacterium]|nr:PTS sugar transporter subunit IIA [Nitrospinota bacterium]
MNITDYLTADLVMPGFAPADKDEAIGKMVDHLVAAGRLGEDRRDPLFEKLMEREGLSSTGIGGGVAIPHASGENIADMLVVMALCPDGLEFGALDGQPVRIIFLIVGSERSPKVHLQLLATIVRACRNQGLVNGLVSTATAGDAFAILSVHEKQSA